jgi:hypothetical protein
VHFKPEDVFDSRVVVAVSRHLPVELLPDLKLTELGLSPGRLAVTVVRPGMGQTEWLEELNGEPRRWITIRQVQSSCAWHRFNLRLWHADDEGSYRSDRTILIEAGAERSFRRTCCLPAELDLTKLGLDEDRRGQIHRELISGCGDNHPALCRAFPFVLTHMCRSLRDFIRVAQDHNLYLDSCHRYRAVA